MRKLLTFIVSIGLILTTGCNKAHWSHEECVKEIVVFNDLEEYSYTVEEVKDHGETSIQGDVYCFDITVSSGEKAYRYYCFTVVNDGQVIQTDCDRISLKGV